MSGKHITPFLACDLINPFEYGTTRTQCNLVRFRGTETRPGGTYQLNDLKRPIACPIQDQINRRSI